MAFLDYLTSSHLHDNGDMMRHAVLQRTNRAAWHAMMRLAVASKTRLDNTFDG